MNNDGKCECGGYIIFESILQCGNKQIWRCTDCEQIYYREIGRMDVYKTLQELEAAKA